MPHDLRSRISKSSEPIFVEPIRETRDQRARFHREGVAAAIVTKDPEAVAGTQQRRVMTVLEGGDSTAPKRAVATQYVHLTTSATATGRSLEPLVKSRQYGVLSVTLKVQSSMELRACSPTTSVSER
jgi:hypothetical protein